MLKKRAGPFVVEGYNKNDYISGIYNWEILFVAGSDRKLAEEYLYSLPDFYVARVKELVIEPLSETLENKHWEIYLGV